MKVFVWLMEALEVLGGSRPVPPSLAGRWPVSFFTPVWWAALLLAALLFMGQGIKFIYIDF
jgi:hypothetical protein